MTTEKIVEVEIPDDEDPKKWVSINDMLLLVDFTNLSYEEACNAYEEGIASVELL